MVYEGRNKIKAGKITIPVIPLNVLIEMKEKADRPQDIADVYYLKKIKKEWGDED